MKYFLKQGTDINGPFSLEEILTKTNQKELDSNCLIQTEEETDWKPLSSIVPITVHQADRASVTSLKGNDVANLMRYDAMKKSPGLAGILNFFIPGLGFLYAGRLVLGLICLFIIFPIDILFGTFSFGLFYLFMGLLWGYGGYSAANTYNRKLLIDINNGIR